MIKVPSHLLKVIKHRPIMRSLSILSTKHNKIDLPQDNSAAAYIPIYRFPFVRGFGLINRLKLYHTVFSGIAVSGAVILNEFDVVNNDSVYFLSVIGLTGCATLYSLGSLANNFIGFVYLNKEENLVKVAYLDYWGRRKDVEMPLEDIAPMSENPVSVMDRWYLKFKRHSCKETLKISFKYGEVLDNKKYSKVFEKF